MSRDDGPDEGLEWVPPHGYSQTVRWDGEAVVKAFSNDTVERAAVERALLSRLASEVPVPRLLPAAKTSEVRTRFVRGILGQEWVAQGRPATDATRVRRHVTFLSQCGQVLRSLHRVEHAAAAEADADAEGVPLPGDGP